MSLGDGTYRILSPLKTEHSNFRVVQHASQDPCVSGSDSQAIYIEHVFENNYTIQYSKGHDHFFGPSDDITTDNTLKSRPGTFEWTIVDIGPGQYKVRIPGQQLYWQIHEDVESESKITLSKNKNTSGEIWIFSWADRESPP
ncbi:hypothetical protein FRC12_021114 [Ceratobasidium sp. 428]|nr:hypothetical protein FRC12_021114 [Ceratobasidium sp. 428]